MARIPVWKSRWSQLHSYQPFTD